ncbi:MAG TPA: hypothetical protein VGT61_08830 [Thermomicrobiales bacterium]|nr:hypothetical protein [Thermomicrobiales bacterium]
MATETIDNGRLRQRAQVTADALIALDGVVAVVLGGSLGRALSGEGDPADSPGDIDLHVYVDRTPDAAIRRAAIEALGGQRIEGDRHFWETDDIWYDGETGTLVEVMYRDTSWIVDEVPKRLERHEASIGYTTSVLDSVRDGIPLANPDGWFRQQQAAASVPYPDGLTRAIVAKNWPILRIASGGYRYQIGSAIRRGDANSVTNSVTNRVAAALDSYWDILFALNGAFHPGEKRLVAHATRRCPDRPADLDGMVRRLLSAAAPAGHGDALSALDALLDDLDRRIVARLGALPAWPPATDQYPQYP